MKFKLLSDTRISAVFVLIFLLGPIYSSNGLSMVMLNIFNFKILSEGYVFLIIDLIIAFVLSNVIFWYYDRRVRKGMSKHNK